MYSFNTVDAYYCQVIKKLSRVESCCCGPARLMQGSKYSGLKNYHLVSLYRAGGIFGYCYIVVGFDKSNLISGKSSIFRVFLV